MNVPLHYYAPTWGDQPPQPPVGWICPVCGTGVAWWRATHCDRTPPVVAAAATREDKADA